MTCCQADDVADGDERVAGAEEDDRALRVAEATAIDDERQHGGRRRDEAERRPQCQPEPHERALVGAEVDSVARHGAVAPAARPRHAVQVACGIGHVHQRRRAPARSQ